MQPDATQSNDTIISLELNPQPEIEVASYGLQGRKVIFTKEDKNYFSFSSILNFGMQSVCSITLATLAVKQDSSLAWMAFIVDTLSKGYDLATKLQVIDKISEYVKTQLPS
ncbi:MAG: hypothetical protein BGO10_03875 [Chlamydia sp. 32-24]|nr:MAG: hypothetical protein BGO10_03875 [Chlamydia sp. 32-24]